MFEALFGIKESKIKKTCVLMPLVARDILLKLGIKKLSRGKLYSAANADHFTLIRTGMGTNFLGDAVLYLEDTPCENILLFGSCGSLGRSGDLTIGSLVSPIDCYACESFSNVLQDKVEDCEVFRPDESLLEKLIKYDKKGTVKMAHCVTFASLKMEGKKLKFFSDRGIDVVDMECSALFAASDHIKRKAAALFYITDIVETHPFYEPLPAGVKTNLISSINDAVDILRGFTEVLSKK